MARSLLVEAFPEVVRPTTPGEFAETPIGKRDTELFELLFGSPTPYFGQVHVANDDNQDITATDAAIKGLLSKFSMHLSEHVRRGILLQTRRLLDPENLEDSELPSIDSYRTMLRCIVKMQPRLRPNLGLSDNGMFLAAWKTAAERLIIDFRPMDRVNWTASDARFGQPNTTSGQTTVQKMLDLIDALDVRHLLDGPA